MALRASGILGLSKTPAALLWQEKKLSGFMVFKTRLHYDEANDLAFCHICSVAYKDGKLNNHTLDKAFIINGFSNWKDASVSFKKHDSSKCHCVCLHYLDW